MKLTAESTVFNDDKVQSKFAELVVDADGIRTEVGKKVGNTEVISRINQSAERVKIQADKVNIEGAAIFTGSGRLSTTSLNNTYDANGAATGSVNTLKNDLASASGTTVINGGHITTGSISIGQVNNLQSTLNGKAASGAENTAISYITDIGNDGIRVHDSHTSDNSIVINSSGMEVFKGGTGTANSVAFYGDTARVGKSTKQRVEVTSSVVSFYDSNNKERTQVNTSGLLIKNAAGNTKASIYDTITLYGGAGTYPLTEITSSNVKIAQNASNYANVNSDGLQVYQGGSEVASFGATATIGTTSGGYVFVDSDSVDIHKGSTLLASFGVVSSSASLTVGSTSNDIARLQPAALFFKHQGSDALSYNYHEIRYNSNSYISFDALSSGVMLTYKAQEGHLMYNEVAISDGDLKLATNNKAIYGKDTNGAYQDIMRLDTGNALVLGYGNYTKNASGYNAWLEGYNVYLRARQKCYANGSQITTSDKRLKKDIVPISDKFKSLFMDLQPVEYKMEQSEDKDIHLGLTAQDVEMAFMKNNISIEKYALVDEYEYPEEKTRYKALAYTEFIPMCIQMIQSQQKELETLKGELNALRRN